MGTDLLQCGQPVGCWAVRLGSETEAPSVASGITYRHLFTLPAQVADAAAAAAAAGGAAAEVCLPLFMIVFQYPWVLLC